MNCKNEPVFGKAFSSTLPDGDGMKERKITVESYKNGGWCIIASHKKEDGEVYERVLRVSDVAMNAIVCIVVRLSIEENKYLFINAPMKSSVTEPEPKHPEPPAPIPYADPENSPCPYCKWEKDCRHFGYPDENNECYSMKHPEPPAPVRTFTVGEIVAWLQHLAANELDDWPQTLLQNSHNGIAAITERNNKEPK